jgi:subtilisin family serine protease
MRCRNLQQWLVLLTALCFTFPAAAQAPEFFYYADGERVELDVVPDVVAAQFARVQAAAQAQSRFDELVTGAQVYTPAAVAGDPFVLLPTAADVDANDAAALAQTIENTRELGTIWANPVFRIDAIDLVLTDEFIAGFPPGTPRETIDAYNARNGARIVAQIGANAYLLRVIPGTQTDALTLANRYEEEGVASYGEPNFYTLFDRSADPEPEPLAESIDRFSIPNDPLFSLQWYLNNTGQFSGSVANVDIQAPEAWQVSQGSSNVIIAVLDDGIQINHPDLAAKIVFPYDAVTGDNDPSPFDTALTRSRDGHGTAVAGLTAASSDNSVGVSGVCRLCRIMPIRIFRSENTSSGVQLVGSIAITVNAINWATNNGAAVLSNSWGQSPSTSVTNAFRNAVLNGRGGLGAVVVIAAGNSYQATVAYPARLAAVTPGILAVGASNWCGQLKTPTANACNSNEGWGNNWGSEVGISAPGHRLITTDVTGADGYVGDDYVYFNGTSGSTPIVSGVAGLLIAQNPTWNSDQVRERLMRSALDTAPAGYHQGSGWGIVDADAALRAVLRNTGIVNDNFAEAVVASSLPFTQTQSVLGAFVTREEPALCVQTANTVWFRYTPAYSQMVTVTTAGSNFDTVVGVYTGSPGSFASVGCNDDAPGVATSSMQFSANAGTTYYVLAGAYGGTSSSPNGVPANTASLTINISTTTPPPAISITGTVLLAGRDNPPDARWSIPLSLSIAPQGGAAIIATTVVTDNTGAFTFTSGLLTPGTYDLWIKNARSLGRRLVVTLTAGSNAVSFGLLREGDANDDNQVTLTDFSILATSFNRSSGAMGYDARADFNGDNAVTLQDFSLLAGNFNVLGDPPLGSGAGSGGQ